jgi:outer membrane lipoprotein carrier protein
MDFVKFSPRLHRATSRAVFIVLIGVLAPIAGFAQEQATDTVRPTTEAAAEARLERFAASIADLSADFEQLTFDEDGEIAEDPQFGRFQMLRPNRFIWRVDVPDEIELVADGERLYYYDVGLEQVEIGPLDQLDNSPAMLLSGEGTIGDDYRLAEVATDDGLHWIELTPLDPVGSDFGAARIGFDDEDIPVAFEFVDGIGYTTRVDLHNVEANTGLTPERFEFEPPDGVRVVGGDD